MVKYKCFGKSVLGASHERKKLPNQDAIRYFPVVYPEIAEGLPIILAVSDGHGSAKSFRSDVGSKKAVEIAIEVIQKEIQAIKSEEQKEKIQKYLELKDQVKNKLQQRIVREICRRWQTEVQEHWDEHSATKELTKLEQQEGRTAREQVEANPLIAYGATLLCVIVTELFIAYLQLGDGDIICVDTQGNTTRPIPKDESLIANETTSLCLKDAWTKFEFKTDIFYSEDSADKKPALILVSTDGLSNSYSSDEGFRKIGGYYLEMIRSNGIKSVADQLKTDLDNISRQGSGDDITLGMIFRQEASDKGEEKNDENQVYRRFSEHQSSQSQLSSNSALNTENLPENDSVNDMEKKNNQLNAIAIVLVLLFGAVGISFGVWFWFLLNGINTRLNDLQRSVTNLEKSPLSKQIEEINQKIGELETKIADLTAESTPSPESDRTSSDQSQTTENKEGNKTNESGETTPRQSDRPKPNQPQTPETNTQP